MALILSEFQASSEVVKAIQVTQLGLYCLSQKEVAPSRISYLPLNNLLVLFIYENTNLINI